MKGRFVIRDQGELFEYNNFDSIPEVFDHLISFEPEIPPDPHTHEQHQEMNKLTEYLQELMKRERR